MAEGEQGMLDAGPLLYFSAQGIAGIEFAQDQVEADDGDVYGDL